MFELWHTCTCRKCKCTNHPIFSTVMEHGRKLTINNNDGSHICIIRLDGCVYPEGDSHSKCDYLFTIESSDGTFKKVLFVELKGGNYEDAYNQIETSINSLKQYLDGFKREAKIVAKKCPKADSSKDKKKKDYFAKTLNTKLTFNSGECTLNHSFI